MPRKENDFFAEKESTREKGENIRRKNEGSLVEGRRQDQKHGNPSQQGSIEKEPWGETTRGKKLRRRKNAMELGGQTFPRRSSTFCRRSKTELTARVIERPDNEKLKNCGRGKVEANRQGGLIDKPCSRTTLNPQRKPESIGRPIGLRAVRGEGNEATPGEARKRMEK